MSNFISAELTAESQAKALELLAQLRALIPFGIKLTSDQKKVMAKVDDARLPFVEKALQFGKQEPRIVPPFTELNEYTRDLGLYRSLGPVENEVLSLAEMISDTRMAAGADAFQSALSIYNSSKGAAKSNIPGTQTIVDELGKLFNGRSKTVTQQKS
jgi:hypothetical protein